MGSIGDTFPYAAPAIGSFDWNNWILCMDELITRVSNTIPMSSIAPADINMGNKSITNIKGLEFNTGATSVPSTPGLIKFYNDEWYLVTAAGTIQVTSAGQLNAAAVGGIGGDYGSGPELVSFNNAASRYDFYENLPTGAWGYVRARALDVAAGATSTFRARVTYGGAGDLDFTLPPTLPAVDVNLLTIDPAGQIDYNKSSNKITGDIYLDSTGPTRIRHGEFEVVYTAKIDLVGLGTATQGLDGYTFTAAPASVYTFIPQEVEWRIKSVTVYMNKVGAGNAGVDIYRATQYGAAASIANNTVGGAGDVSCTVTIPGGSLAATTSGVRYVVGISPNANGDQVFSICVKYDSI